MCRTQASIPPFHEENTNNRNNNTTTMKDDNASINGNGNGNGNSNINGNISKRKTITCRELGVWEKSLEDQANWFSWITLSYLNPLLKQGSSQVLQPDDIGVPSQQDIAHEAYMKVQACWEQQRRKTEAANAYQHALAMRRGKPPPPDKEPSLAFPLFQAFGLPKMVFAMSLYLVSSLLSFVPVLILADLVRYFQSEGTHETFVHPWVEVFGLALVPFLVSILQTRYQVVVAHAGVFVRAAVSLMLYHKSLTVSAAGRAKTSTGQVVNIMSNDSQQLQRLLMFVGMGFVAPVQIILALALIYREVGNAMWAGVGFMLLLAPLNGMVFGTIGKLRRKVLLYSDSRVKLINEILTGIRIIKFYAWEVPFGKEVNRLRGSELKALTQYAYFIACIFSLILSSVPFIQPILVFSVYTAIQPEPLDAATAFSTIALFNLMRIPFAFLPMVFLQWIQSKIALKRIGRYLELPELTSYVQHVPPPNATSVQQQIASVTICNGTFAWVDPTGKPVRGIEDEKTKPARRRNSNTKGGGEHGASEDDSSHQQEQKKLDFVNKELQASIRSVQTTNSEDASSGTTPIMALVNINTTIPAGSLVAVVGSVGSGKSSLLSAILGEMERLPGSEVYIPRHDGVVAEGFVSYTAQTPWIVNDTLQGNILFGRPYDEERYHLVTEAAALMDDLAVLPAGDLTEIGENGINLSGGQKARVSLARALYGSSTQLMLLDDPLSAVDAHVGEHLFTHAICGPVSQGVTRILVTHASHVLARCDYVIVMDKGTIKHQGSHSDLIAQGVDFAGAVDVSKHRKKDDNEDDDSSVAEGDGNNVSASHEKKGEILSEDKKEAMQKSGKKLTTDEDKAEGSVDGSAYVKYARAGGFVAAFSVLACAVFGRGSDVAGAFWLSRWATEGFQSTEGEGTGMSDEDTRYYLGFYSMFALLGLLGITLQGICFANLRLRASRKLHDDLTTSILRAPIAFFDVTPIGRVLNRFAADMDKVDLELVQSLQQGLSMLFSILGAVGAIIAATKGVFLLPMIPLGYVYYLIQGWFRRTSTELQR
jgi:ATP-binding cassette, subfamily C (CFTR/MRP), member 1